MMIEYNNTIIQSVGCLGNYVGGDWHNLSLDNNGIIISNNELK